MINEVLEGPQEQSSGEVLAYSITTTPWGGSPSNITVKAFEARGGTDVTTAVFPSNVPSKLGDVVTTDMLKLLSPGKTYRIIIGWDDADGYHWEAMFKVTCTF